MERAQTPPIGSLIADLSSGFSCLRHAHASGFDVRLGMLMCRQQHLTRQTVSVYLVIPDLIAVVSRR
jgi:hypothetical protein